jgi:hypothetical protein
MASDQSVTTAEPPVHPVQTHHYRQRRAVAPQSVTMRAYEVYCHVYGPQEALVTGGCKSSFSTGELVGFVYAHSFSQGRNGDSASMRHSGGCRMSDPVHKTTTGRSQMEADAHAVARRLLSDLQAGQIDHVDIATIEAACDEAPSVLLGVYDGVAWDEGRHS